MASRRAYDCRRSIGVEKDCSRRRRAVLLERSRSIRGRRSGVLSGCRVINHGSEELGRPSSGFMLGWYWKKFVGERRKAGADFVVRLPKLLGEKSFQFNFGSGDGLKLIKPLQVT